MLSTIILFLIVIVVAIFAIIKISKKNKRPAKGNVIQPAEEFLRDSFRKEPIFLSSSKEGRLAPGTRLQKGKYVIIDVLGQGGFGITYTAEQVALQRKVAIKEFFIKDCCERDNTTGHVTLGTTSGNRDSAYRFRQKFIREAQMIASLEHPNIVRIYDVFEENGTAYYVMEYHSGGSLMSLIQKNGPISISQSLEYVNQVGDALSYLHAHNLLHFDIKPSNILLNKLGQAVLIDFGISKHYDEQGAQTSSTPIGISNGYAPLEQYQQSGISSFTPATDIYALGATMYTLLTGCIPPSSSEVNENGLPLRPDNIPESVWLGISKAMSPRRKDRPQSVAEMLSIIGYSPLIDPERTILK